MTLGATGFPLDKKELAMTDDLWLGAAVISITVLLHTVGLITVTNTMSLARRWFRLHRHEFGRTMAMIATVLLIFIVHGIEIWLWALVYIAVGALPDIESALYFSTTTFSTIGYGDVVLSSDWRLLGSLEGIGGLLLIGWSTAYLVAASMRHGPLRVGEHLDVMRQASTTDAPAGDGGPFG
jgi:hypothetical protein